jgi:hypothetical protein
MVDGTCSVPGCDGLSYVKLRSLCQRHYGRWKRHGDPLGGGSFRAPRGTRRPCSVANCAKPAKARGWCEMHYQRWKNRGDPLAKRRIAEPGQADFYKQGYHFIHADGRIIQEHRLVVEQQLGRPLLPGENVHHRNGDRADNRPANLELWLTHQPKGGRVADLLAFVVERYPKQLAAMLRQPRAHGQAWEHPMLW